MKRTIIKIGMGVLFAAAFTFFASAQEMGGGEGGEVVYKKRTVIDFSDVTIEGELTKPQGSYISTRRSSRFNKLIKIRENFIPEMDMSIDNL
ncbi:MAG: hypothetical protein Kow0090_09710 [Myxococcota bacterium]